jgi:hypothetical protein
MYSLGPSLFDGFQDIGNVEVRLGSRRRTLHYYFLIKEARKNRKELTTHTASSANRTNKEFASASE